MGMAAEVRAGEEAEARAAEEAEARAAAVSDMVRWDRGEMGSGMGFLL